MKIKVKGKMRISDYEEVLILPFTDRTSALQLIKEQETAKHPYVAEIKQERPKKTKTANDYCWVLCTEIAKVLSKEYPTTKEDVYRRLIRDSNYFYIVPIKDEAVEKYIQIWSGKGVGWVAEIAYKSKLEGFTTLHCYYGSSEYDSKEMSDLINSLKEEAKELGVQTLSPEEEKRLLESWGKP